MGNEFRAYDKATGSVIWEMELPSGTTAGPMTYALKGKQYIVVAVGARNIPPSTSRCRCPEAKSYCLQTTTANLEPECGARSASGCLEQRAFERRHPGS